MTCSLVVPPEGVGLDSFLDATTAGPSMNRIDIGVPLGRGTGRSDGGEGRIGTRDRFAPGPRAIAEVHVEPPGRNRTTLEAYGWMYAGANWKLS